MGLKGDSVIRKSIIAFAVIALICSLISLDRADTNESFDRIEYRFKNKTNLEHPIEVSILTSGADIRKLGVRDLRKSFYRYSGTFVEFIGVIEAANPSFPIRLTGYPIIEIFPMIKDSKWEWEKGHRYEFTGFAIQYRKHKDYDSIGFDTLRVYIFDRKHLGKVE